MARAEIGEGVYGYRLDRDSAGRVARLINLDGAGRPMANRIGAIAYALTWDGKGRDRGRRLRLPVGSRQRRTSGAPDKSRWRGPPDGEPHWRHRLCLNLGWQGPRSGKAFTVTGWIATAPDEWRA